MLLYQACKTIIKNVQAFSLIRLILPQSKSYRSSRKPCNETCFITFLKIMNGLVLGFYLFLTDAIRTWSLMSFEKKQRHNSGRVFMRSICKNKINNGIFLVWSSVAIHNLRKIKRITKWSDIGKSQFQLRSPKKTNSL